MKRWIALLLALVLCLSLGACGKKVEETPEDDTAVEQQDTQKEDTEDKEKDKEPKQDEEPNEDEEPVVPVVYRHPLTGEVLNAPWSGSTVAVMINNLRAAMPQCGISGADVFCELEVESGVTRCLAIYTNLAGVGSIGPVRSARTGFVSMSTAFEAPLVHCGGSDFALNAQYSETERLENWQHINEISSDGIYFFRDSQRSQQGYDYEHTLFTNGEKLSEALKVKGMDVPKEMTLGWSFQEGVDLKGEKAEEVVITFKHGKTSTFLYDPTNNVYKMAQHGRDNVDGNTGEVVCFKNVIAIYVNQKTASNGVHQFYDSIGTGEGYAAINGTIVPILWSRSDVYAPYSFTLGDGTPLQMDVGTTYLAMVGIQNEISYK